MQSTQSVLAEDPIGAFVSLPSAENPDWSYARNQRAVLMVTSAEWVQSVFSCHVELNGKRFVTPNRDYPYEGLLAFQDGENWKFIDCIAVGIQGQDGAYLPLIIDPGQSAVRVNPWRISYRYFIPGDAGEPGLPDRNPLIVSYYLNSLNTPEHIGGCVEVYLPQGYNYAGQAVTPVIQPFLDIRHMYAASDFSLYRRHMDQPGPEQNRVQIGCYNRRLTFTFPRMETVFFEQPEILDWHYKLGTGSREEISRGQSQGTATVFTSETKNVASFFRLHVPENHPHNFVRLYFDCALTTQPTIFTLPEMVERHRTARRYDLERFHQLQETFALQEDSLYTKAVLARIEGLTKFKTYVQPLDSDEFIPVPYAGAWWFRTPWYRDVFEGLLNSFNCLMRLPAERDAMRKIIWLALREQDPVSGRILNRIPEFKHLQRSYNNSDGTLLAFILAHEYIRHTRDMDFAAQVLPHLEILIDRFSRASDENNPLNRTDGPPRIHESSGLLLSVPYHSWIDTRNQRVDLDGRRISGLPNRASQRFIHELYNHIQEKDRLGEILALPRFFLPEINAQWIVLLRGALETIDLLISQEAVGEAAPGNAFRLRDKIRRILARAERNFEPVFWNTANGFLFNLVYENQAVRDTIVCEVGVTAAAMLSTMVLTSRQLNQIWQRARAELLVYRRLVGFGDQKFPFGILTKNDGRHIFYDDQQYHADVVWLRSTPYLIRLLELLEQDGTIKQILINALDHQMSEGAIFYNHELLARPAGNNPQPDPVTHLNPVPVKNPIQFWSQWCDVFVNAFETRSK